ncbi:CsbD family protein [Kutzneria buriramensis]|uniref:CsbD-like protein n=1 Tax=Kutzneria buriramensis TaxID=1045776 RepID=A0A3E0HIV4_9PSEU|nr:CsbD family protein [Kutzneria buriramensis]REH46126.1 CsbD-like protein [Kutzneria buriramensis]
MSTERKIDATADDVKGKVKEGVGKATDDDNMTAEGKGDQAKGKVKQAVEDVKDAFKRD